MRLSVLLGIALFVASPAMAQSVAERLQGAAPEVVSAVEAAVSDAASRGLPTQPLVQKAIEGTAKGAAPERVTAAVQALLGRLGQSAAALREGGLSPLEPAAIEAGALAIQAGLASEQLAALARASARTQAVQVTLQVAGTLAASGVPAAQVVELVSQALAAGDPPGQLLKLPAQVQSAVARGATPAAAAAGLARAAEARARRPEPPRRGPPNRP